jgi:hypothetical protein
VSAVAAPADRRFRRAHVKPARRKRTWRALAWPAIRYGLVALVASLAIYRGVQVSAKAHLLEVNRIVVHGNERLSRGEVLAVLSGLRGESLLWTDLERGAGGCCHRRGCAMRRSGVRCPRPWTSSSRSGSRSASAGSTAATCIWWTSAA